MKILFSGYHNPHFITITEYIEKAIRKLGHTSISFDDRNFIVPGKIREKLPFLQHFDLARINKNLLSLAYRHKPFLCLVTGGHRIFQETIKKIKDRGIITILWTIDAPVNFQPIIETASYYDYVFCGGTEAMEILKDNGINKCRWLPFAGDPEFHKPTALTKEEKLYGHDITFVGSYYPNRAKILANLCDFDLIVRGPGWERLPLNNPLHKCIEFGHVKLDKWMKIYSDSKIVIIIHYQDKNTLCYQASPKVYESLACRAFVLVDNQRDVFKLFEDRKHLVKFNDIDDLKNKIKYYLEHPEERIRIADNGYNETLANHTYEHRINKMLSIIKCQIP